MKVAYKPSFIRDLKRIKGDLYERIRDLCFEEIPQYDRLEDVPLDVKKIAGFKEFYRIRIGDYRIGVQWDGEMLVFMRVLHRRDIYRYFP
ncbi:MAG: type II toxin-antitoxin system RelE/ParE family toxin [Candidatus Latescibacterota bacterium]|nr:MAG: type II toxin-antitoxin system RelE/ParE family toxin [Candidatus Latescibacterota bacterium]